MLSGVDSCSSLKPESFKFKRKASEKKETQSDKKNFERKWNLKRCFKPNAVALFLFSSWAQTLGGNFDHIR